MVEERNKFQRILYAPLRVITVVAALATFMAAQTFTGSIRGRITDPQGYAIEGISVSLIALAKGERLTIRTSEVGEYTFVRLQPGTYEVEVEASKFVTQRITAQLSVSQDLRLDVQMAIQSSKESLDVKGEVVAVETQNAQLSTLVNQRQVSTLPLITRNPYDLLGLSPGVTDGPDRGSINQRGAGFAVNGQRSQSSNFLLDGGENNDAFTSQPGQNVPLDSILELRVQTNNYSAEYGRNSGLVANVVTKSGGNDFHGTLYEFNRNSALSAEDSYLKANGVKKPTFNRNQFGGSFGGPLQRNNTFFFGSAEALRTRSMSPTFFYVPTPQLIAASSAASQSIFSAFPPPVPTGKFLRATDLGISALTAADGTTLSPSTPLFGRVTVPVPGDGGAGLPQNTFLWTSRVDHRFSDRTSVFARYAYERVDLFSGTNSTSPYAEFNTGAKNRNHNATVQLVHSFAPTVVSESRLVYNRLDDDQPLSKAPISPSFFITSVMSSQPDASVTLPGYFATPNRIGNAIPFGGPQNLYQLYSSLSYVHGSHITTLGGQYVQLRDNRTFGAYENAIADFETVQAFINGNVEGYYIAVDPKGKFPGQVLNGPFGPPSFTRHYRYNDAAWFAQETWNPNKRLTITLGLRWEYFGVLHGPGNEKRLDSNFYLGSGANVMQQVATGSFELTTQQTGDLRGYFYKPDFNNYAPRLGLAYSLDHDSRTVLRAGYGIFYDRDFGAVLFNVIQNPPNYAVLATGQGNGGPEITANINQYAALAPVSGTTYSSSGRALDPNLRTAYANVWNANLQRKLAGHYVLTLAYAASNGIKLYSLDNVNRSGSGVLLGRPNTRLNQALSAINLRSNSGHSNYQSLQSSVDGPYLKGAGLQFHLAYTLSHSLDNQSSTLADSYLLSTAGAGLFGTQDPFNAAADQGSADFDARHRFVASVIWDVPFGRKLGNPLLRRLLSGWTVNSISSFRTGYPFSIFAANVGVPAGNDGSQAIRPLVNGSQPPILPNLPPASAPGTFDYVDVTGLTVPPSLNGPFNGTLGRNTYRAPGLVSWNASLIRTIKLSETKRLELRGEFFNPLNHANLFVAPGTNTIARPNPVVQVTRGGSVNAINNNEQHRNVQVALKLVF
jgi:hypothetical protein